MQQYDIKDWVQIFMYAATGVAALSALFTYRRSAKLERAKWLKEFYEKFYENSSLKEVRDILDNEDDKEALALVQQESSKFTDYLNFFEFLGYLGETRQITIKAMLGTFEYYLRKLKEKPCVLLYVNDKRKGYEKLKGLLTHVRMADHLFVYGTLMRGFDSVKKWKRLAGASLVGFAEIPGVLYDLGEYPGATNNIYQKVQGELYKLKNPEATFEILDGYEEYEPLNPEKSLFQRTLIQVQAGTELIDAWVYYYKGPTDGFPVLSTGNYRDSKIK